MGIFGVFFFFASEFIDSLDLSLNPFQGLVIV